MRTQSEAFLAPQTTRSPLGRAMTERRRHRRMSVSLPARFLAADREEHTCRIFNVSAGGAAFETTHVVADGERIVMYIDDLGRFEAIVRRRGDGMVSVEFQMTPHKREKLVSSLTWLINRDLLDDETGRRHARIQAPPKELLLDLPNGGRLYCKVLDVSISGASLATEARPEIDTMVMLGKLKARVARHHAEGIGLQFVEIQNPRALKRTFS